jgi:hypothetical protein
MATPTVYTPKPLSDPSQPGVAAGTLYTVPASTTTKLTEIIMVNDTTTAVKATLYLVPNGGAAGVTNLLINAMTIPVDGSPLVLEFGELYLETGATIQALASVADQVTVHLSGVELA